MAHLKNIDSTADMNKMILWYENQAIAVGYVLLDLSRLALRRLIVDERAISRKQEPRGASPRSELPFS